MNGVVIGVLALATVFQQTDTVFPAGTASKLSVEAPGGSIVVDVWDREEIRVRAEHSTRTFVEIDRGRTTIELEAEARRGPATIVDFHITVPRDFDLDLEGMYTDITVEGADGEVAAESVQGDVVIVGGRGVVTASSMTGRVLIEGSEGRVEAESAAAEIRVRDAAGEIYAESAGGDIILEDVRATSVDVGSVGGRVYYDGTLDPSGTYFFGSHGGSVTLVVPQGSPASFNLSTVHGSISSNLEGAPTRFERGKRHAFDVGGGGALVEAETFGGRIRIMRKGTEGGAPARRQVNDGAAWAGGLALAGAEWAESLAVAISGSVTLGVGGATSSAASVGLGEAISTAVSASVGEAVSASVADAVSAAVSADLASSRPARVNPRRR